MSYGNIAGLVTKLEVRIEGKSLCTLLEGDIVDVNYADPVTGRSGCTGKLKLIGVDSIIVDCSKLYCSDSREIKRSRILSISKADKSHIKDMFDSGEEYL